MEANYTCALVYDHPFLLIYKTDQQLSDNKRLLERFLVFFITLYKVYI